MAEMQKHLCNWVSQQDFDSQSLACISSPYVFSKFYDNILLKDTSRRISLKMNNDNRTRKVFVGFVCLLLVCLLNKFVLSELEGSLNGEEHLLLLQTTEVWFPADTELLTILCNSSYRKIWCPLLSSTCTPWMNIYIQRNICVCV